MELNKLYHESCLVTLSRLDDRTVDFICTDPPYLLDNHGGGTTEFSSRKLVKDKHIDHISSGFDFEVLDECCRVLKHINCMIFCSNKQVSSLMGYFEVKKVSTTLLVWKKKNPIPFGNGKFLSDIEFIVYARDKGCPFNQNGKNFSKIFEYSSPHTKIRIHPTQKPLGLVKELVELCSNVDDVVCDPFAGSGTTLVAAQELGRQWIGSEISLEYYESAMNRINLNLEQNSLF